MKTSNYIAVIGLTLLAISADASAAQVSRSQTTRSATPEELARVRERETRDKPGEVISDVASFPMRALRSVVRTPVIVGDTLAGKRELMDPLPKWREEQLAEGRD